MAGGFGEDLFGGKSQDEEPQDSLFGDADGTDSKRSLAATESSARSEIGRLKQEQALADRAVIAADHPTLLAKHAKRQREIAMRLAVLEKLTNRDKAITADEMATRAKAGENDMFSLGEKVQAYHGKAAGYGAQETPQGAIDRIKAAHPDVQLDVFVSKLHPDTWQLAHIRVPKTDRNTGVGTNVMRELTQAADAHGARITLTPGLEGGKARLRAFYRDFGFKKNRSDFAISDSMIREPGATVVREPGADYGADDTAHDEVDQHIKQLRDSGDEKAAANLERFMDGSVIRDRLYRGDFRADKLGTVFKKGRATSGRFYFTDDPDVAGKYATGKQDLQHKGHEDYANWFKVKTGPGKRDVAPLNRAWYSLTKDQRTRLQDTLMRARADENTGKLTFDGPADGGIASLDHWKHVLGESRGDWLTAAKDVWLDSGALFDDEHQFGDILKHAGIDVEMDSPHESRPGTTPVFVSIRRPLIAEQVPADVVEAIQSLAKRDRSVARPGYDMWDKNSITLRDWIKDRFDGSLSHDEGTWATQVPEKVTKLLQAMGYDGIRHDGGVSTGGKHHHVWIAFEPNQIKSAVGNKGTFNPNTNNIIAEPGADYGEQHGMFGDEPADEPATGIKNAVSAETRESLGMGERVRPEPRTQKEMYDAGKATAASDPTAIPRLIAELRDNPEKIVGTETEAGLLLKHRVDLENKLLALVAARDEAIKGDDAPAEHLARLQLAEHREQIKEFVHLAERTGTAAGRALAARKMMSKLDYSLSHMETMAEAAKGSPLTYAELERIKKLHDEVVIKLAAAEKDAAASNERAAEAEADLHHAQLRATAMQPVMDRVSTKLGSAADAAKARIRARGMRAMAGMDPVDLADHAIIGADALAKGLIRFAEWSHAMKETFGTEIAPHLREIFDASNETLNKELKQARALEPRTTTKPGAQKGPAVPPVSIRARLQARLDGGTSLSDLRPYLRQLALEHIRKGIIGREALLDALHTDVLETGASVTRAQTRDALSGYGVFRPLDKAADKAKLRDIQAEAQKLAQLEALQKGKAPLATGFERQGPNDETRKLTKQVNEAKKAAGIAQIDDASRLKSALGAAKTRIRNAIADLRTEIDTGERMVRGKSVLISDTELDTLRGELAELRKQETEVFGDKTLTDEQRLQRATATAKRTADLWETRVEKARNGAFDATGRRPVMSAPELNALRAKADKARAEYAELRSLDPAQQQLDDQKANARYRANIEKRKAEILDRLARADYTPRAHPPGTKFDRQSIVAKTDLEEVKQRYQDALRKFEKANRTGLEKARDRVVAFTRASVLSSPTVIVKLTAVALSRVVTTPLTDLVALGVSNALPRLAKGAARYGTRSPMVALRAEAAAQTAMWTDGMIDAARQLKNKQSRLTLLHGKHKLPHEWYEYAGSIHAALKEPVKRAEYARALYRLTADAMERGENTTDDFVKLRLSTEAYLHADGAVAMNDNIVTDAWKAGLHRLDRVDPKTGKKPLAGLMLAGALKTDMPIMKAPTNVVIEASEFIAGLPLGAAKAAWSYYHGIEDLKPVERDSIIRLISKGAVGLAIMALVFYKYKDIEFGGYYQRGEHRGPDEVPADAGRIGPTIVSKNLLHNPIFFPAQFAATTARLANTRLHRNDDDPIGYQSALLAAAVGFAEQVPIAGSLVNDLHTALDPKQNAGFLEKKAASILVPSLIQWIAKKTDPDGDLPRKPVGMKQHVMVNVPGLRSRVPIDDKKVQRLQRLSQR
jgi:ribosomal protein S18 acetylase RimI-like enzyme